MSNNNSAGIITLADFETRRSGRARKSINYGEDNAGLIDDNKIDNEGSRNENKKRKQTRNRRQKASMSSSKEEDEDEEEYSSSEEEDAEEDREVVRAAAGLRSVGKKTYAEESSESSEDDDWDRQVDKYRKKQQKEAQEDTQAIHMVLDRRVRRYDKDDDDKDDDDDDDIDIDDENREYEYLINWQNTSHIHNTWHTEEELKGLRGFRRLQNFQKKRMQHDIYRSECTPEEAEFLDIEVQMTLQHQENWLKVDRLVEKYEDEENNIQYLVKWLDLQYADNTWEHLEDIVNLKGFERAYKAYVEREKSLLLPEVKWPPSKPRRFNELLQQPEWLRGGELRDYQLKGLNWLIYSWCKKTNCILADEMGLGKTIQVVSFLAYLNVERKIIRPYLVVVPLSTMTAWKREFAKWAPWLNVVEYVGDSASRETIREQEFYRVPQTSERRRTKAVMAVQVLLTTYELVLKDASYLQSLQWKQLIVDEAHRLKDSSSALYQVLSGFKTNSRLLITGTPLQNSLEELWNLLHFLHPDRFDDLDEWKSKYGGLNDGEQINNLHEELKPHLLRRVKKDVEKSLPAKLERILRVEMTDMQRKYYRWIAAKNFRELNKGVKGTKSSLNNVVMEMKKCCNHPYLFENAEKEDREEFVKKAIANNVSREIALANYDPLRGLIYNSGKLKLLDRLLQRLKQDGHRVLIFTQMVRMLDILSDYLRLRGYQHQRLDGSMNSRARQRAMDCFNAEDSKDFCFILSTRAGGLGINLATADTVIIYDSDWNPQNDLQAEARAHRIGQKNAVNIYRLLSQNTVEERILERGRQKMVLDHLVIQRMDTSATYNTNKSQASLFDNRELVKILQFGAEEIFKEVAEDDNKQLQNETKDTSNNDDNNNIDLDELLSRAETCVTEPGGETEEFLSAFKVANFANDVEEEEEDPEFWKRIIPKEMIPEDQTRDENEVKLWLPPRKAAAQDTYNVNKLMKQEIQTNDNDDDYDDDDDVDDNEEERKVVKKKVYTIDDVDEKDIRAVARQLVLWGDVDRVVYVLQQNAWKKYHLSDSDCQKLVIDMLKKCNIAYEKEKHRKIEDRKKKRAEAAARRKAIAEATKAGKEIPKDLQSSITNSTSRRSTPAVINFQGAEIRADVFRQYTEMALLRQKVEESIEEVKESNAKLEDSKTEENADNKLNDIKTDDKDDVKLQKNDSNDTNRGMTARALKDFRVHLKCPPVTWQNVKWGPREDSRLLLGVFLFGRGGSAWDQIMNHPALELHDVLFKKKSEIENVDDKNKNEFAAPIATENHAKPELIQVVSTNQLRARVNTLLKRLLDQTEQIEQQKSKRRKKDKTKKSKKSKSTKNGTSSKSKTTKSSKSKTTKSSKSKASKSKPSRKKTKSDTVKKKRKTVDKTKESSGDNKDDKSSNSKATVKKRKTESSESKAKSNSKKRKNVKSDANDANETSNQPKKRRRKTNSKGEKYDKKVLQLCKEKLIPWKKPLRTLHQLTHKNGLDSNSKLARECILQCGRGVEQVILEYKQDPDYQESLLAPFVQHLWHFVSYCVKGKNGSEVKMLYENYSNS